MADVAVEHPLQPLPSQRKQISSSIPNIDIDGVGNDDTDEYSTLKRLQRHLEYASALLSNEERWSLTRTEDTSTFKKSTSKTSRGEAWRGMVCTFC